MLFDKNLYEGIAYILHRINLLDSAPIDAWGKDKSIINILKLYGNGLEEKSNAEIERSSIEIADFIISFYGLLAHRKEGQQQRKWFVGQILSLLANEEPQSVTYRRALAIWLEIKSKVSDENKVFWNEVIKDISLEESINNRIKIFLGKRDVRARIIRRAGY
jgi:hypothetical protein